MCVCVCLILNVCMQQFYWINLTRWVVMFWIGVFTAFTAILIDIGIDLISDFKFKVIRKGILCCVLY